MPRLVSLPMYQAPQPASAAFWSGLRGHMRAAGVSDVPDRLTEPDDLPSHWRDPDLLLSQTCGYPLVTALKGMVQYVGTPHYGAAGCEGAAYSSAVMVRDDDPAQAIAALRGRRLAFNHRGSQSGWNGFRALVAPLAGGGGFFGSVVESGSHRRSLALVRDGKADVTPVDCVSLALLARHEPDAVRGLRVLASTPRGVPGLPLITAAGTSAQELGRLRDALSAFCSDGSLADVRAALLFDGFQILPLDAYAACLRMEYDAIRAGYPELA